MRFVLFLAAMLSLLSADGKAAPEPGRYTGVLTVERMVLGTPVKTSARAVARVTDQGGLSIVLLGAPSAFPEKAPQDFSTVITSGDTCVIPRVDGDVHRFELSIAALYSDQARMYLWWEMSGFPEAALFATGGVHVAFPVAEHEGKIEVSRTTFRLTYDDVPDRYRDADGNEVVVNLSIAQPPSKKFIFTFRRKGP